MKKALKRMAAALIAATTMAAGMNSLSVGAAYNLTEPWESRHVNVSGAPSSADYDAVCSIKFSTLGATCYCNAVSNSVNGGTGKTIVSSVNGSMVNKTIDDTGEAKCLPTFVGVVECATYKMSSSTTTSQNIYVASGNIVAKTA